jgi:hypothetical protein
MNKKTCYEISMHWEWIKYKIKKYGYKPTSTEREGLKNYSQWYE